MSEPSLSDGLQRLFDDTDHWAGAIYALLQLARAREKERDQYRRANVLAAQAYVQLEGRTILLQAQLGGWEAACAFQVEALRDVQTFLRYNVVGTAHVESLIGRIEEAIETNAGEILLARLAQLEDAVVQAGHAVACALQYGGTCSCRMQLVRHTKARA